MSRPCLASSRPERRSRLRALLRRRRLTAAALTALAAASAAPAAAGAASYRVFEARYHSTDGAAIPGSPFAGWTVAQAPDRPATARVDGRSLRLGTVENPGRTRVERARYVLRAELQGGDLTKNGSTLRPRAEMLYSGDAVNSGDLRYYAFSLRLGEFAKSNNRSLWTVLTQWKGQNGLEPPLSLQAARGRLRLVRVTGNVETYACGKGGKSTCKRLANRKLQIWDLGRAPTTWTRLVFQIRWSTTGSGRLCVRRDGHTVKCFKQFRTLQGFAPGPSGADPIYLKQGLYRANGWRATQVAYFGPTVIATKAKSAGWSRKR